MTDETGAAVSHTSHARNPVVAVGLVSAAAAVFVGLVYAAGVIETTARINDAGLSVRDALPLVPLQTLLTRGMGVMLIGALGFLLFLIGFWTYTPNAPIRRKTIVPRMRAPKRTPPPEGGRARFIAWWNRHGAIIVIFGVLLLIYSFSGDPLASVRLVLPYVGGFLVGREAIRDRSRAVVWFVVLLVVWIAVNIGHAYVYAVPLPDVQLELRASSTTTEGVLIAHTEATWYLSNQEGQVIAIGDDLVKQATITSAEVPDGRTFWELIGVS